VVFVTVQLYTLEIYMQYAQLTTNCEVSMVERPPSLDTGFFFSVSTPLADRTAAQAEASSSDDKLTLCANTAEDRQAWIEALYTAAHVVGELQHLEAEHDVLLSSVCEEEGTATSMDPTDAADCEVGIEAFKDLTKVKHEKIGELTSDEGNLTSRRASLTWHLMLKPSMQTTNTGVQVDGEKLGTTLEADSSMLHIAERQRPTNVELTVSPGVACLIQ
jgi:hypothetical protein